jgi:ribosomal protein S18 acetylase RimI-like enzyme
LPDIEIIKIKKESEIPSLPGGLSYFPVPYLKYWIKEALDIGGEAFLSKTSNGETSGLFVYDDYEQAGTVFTKSSEVFDHFFKMKPFGSCFSEINVENSNHAFDILSVVNLDGISLDREFKHLITIEQDVPEIERFMSLTHYGLNPKWVRIALGNGDKCFAARMGKDIVGMAWLSLVDSIGRVSDLYVKQQFRRNGIASDLFYARLIYLKSRHARSYFAEIAHDNEAAMKHALKVGLKITGQVYEYFGQ